MEQEGPKLRLKPLSVPKQRNVVAVKRDDEGQLESLDVRQGIYGAGREVGVHYAEWFVAKAAKESRAIPGDPVGDVGTMHMVERKPLEVLRAPTKDLGCISLVIDQLLVDEGLRVGQVVGVENCCPSDGFPEGTGRTFNR
jgi:hypothetical protein